MNENIRGELESIRRRTKSRCVAVVCETSEGEVKVFRSARTSAVQLIGLGEYLKGTGALLMAEKIEELLKKRQELGLE